MAEAFAAVASGAGLVSLALQLADCAVKLKSFCDHVEKAPKKLRRIAGEIETLSLVLHQIEALRVQHGISNSDVLARCIQQCQASTHEIVTSTGAMEIMLRKYKAPGRIVVALKLPELNGLCNDLERAKSNLLLAFQMFQAGLQGSLMATMLALSNQITTLSHLHQPLLPQHACPATLGGPPLVQDTADTSQPEPMPIYKRANPNATNDHRRKYPTPQRRWQLRVRLPLGFSQTVWDISIRQSFRGWEACLQCVNIVPYDSPVFHYVARNDVVIVEKLFREGKASPYDSRVTDYGVGSLLSTSDWVSAEMYAVILSHMRPRDRNSAVETMLQEQHWVQDFEEAKGLSYLVESQDVDMADLGIMTLGLPSLPVVKQNMSNFGYYWDGHVWFDWFTELNYGPLGCTLVAQEFTKYCSDGQGVSGLLPLRSHRRGESVLHYTARRVGQLASYDIQDQESIAGWVQLFSSVMETAGGSALLYDVTHARATEDKISPFMAFLEALYSGGDAPLQQTLSIWQMLLESIGVLADEFLEKEMLLWESLCHRQALRSIFHEIELVGLYQEQSIKAWRGRYVVPIVLYSLPSPAPGSWPVSPYVPRCICWLPRLHHAESVGEDWSEDGVKCMIQLSDSWPLETPSELGGPGRVWRWAPHRWRKAGPWSWEDRIYSDDDDASRILQPRKSSLRRIHTSRWDHALGQDANNFRTAVIKRFTSQL
ncbi:hypothetical protein PRZ48_005283 [Zasmidium cellare]|uniref:NACHT-NTPase and P-loop NTPases N-terminal domain-containing protein n=1 Tax=Zasmidium cellare TaxID=395010 RepID=A0ABR0ESA9_ZASCE|nr:hypothetical protein PRZ48_005283 [Zasmidium cellare]